MNSRCHVGKHFLKGICKSLFYVFCLGCGSMTSAQLVSEGPDGLIYQSYANEGQTNAVNTVPDFSRAGYRGGGVAIPFVPTAVTLSPSGGDDTTAIQNAIDTVSAMPLVDGFRGAVYLSAGDYTVSSTLNIRASGVVIRGAGQQETGGTRITYTATSQSDLFDIAGSGSPSGSGSVYAITDTYVPVGAKTLSITDASSFSVGDMIQITNLVNQNWIEDIGMTAPPLAGGSGDPAWEPSAFQLKHFRFIDEINGNELTLDAPVVQAIEDQYGGGEVRKYTYTNAIENVGIEAIRLESTFTSDNDEDHGWHAIVMRRVMNGWVRQVTSRYFGQGLVLIDSNCLFITVQDSACLDPKSQTTGGRKYSFQVDDSSFALFQRCLTRGGRHDYVSGSLTPGPNAFVDSLATQATSDTGPHFRYATGQIYDNIKSNNEINVQNRLNSGTSHGWAGAQILFWNIEAGGIICDAPTGAMNWSIGAIGTKKQGSWVPDEPYGIWESEGIHVTPRSLYYAQLEERLGMSALNAVIVPAQKSGTIWTDLEAWDGDGLFLDDVVCSINEEATPAIQTPIDIVARVRDLEMRGSLTSSTWSKVSGPGAVSFGSAAQLATTATFTLAGQYHLQLVAENGDRQIAGDLIVNVLDPSDNTPPAAPAGFMATSGYNFVSLEWDDNPEADLAGYTIYRREESQSYGAPLDTGINSSEYVDLTAVNGTTYYYVIIATDVNGNESALSSEVSATPFDNDPSPIISFLAPNDGSSILEGSDLLVEVSATDLDGTIANVKLYLDGQLIRQENSAPYTWGEDSQNDALLENLPLGNYELEAVAQDNDNQTTSVSIALRVVADYVPPSAPNGLSAGLGDGVVDLIWNENDESDLDSYTVYRSTTSGSYDEAFFNGLVSGNFQDTSVANGVTYYYVVTAVDTSGNESEYSTEVSVTPTEIIDLGTDSGKLTTSAAGFVTVVPLSGNENHVADAYRISNGADTSHENFAFLSEFVDMGGANRSDFIITMEASLFSKGTADKNTYRYGIVLFNDSSDLEGGGIVAMLHYDDEEMQMFIREGLNGEVLASQVFKIVGGAGRPYDYPEGETYTFEVTGTYSMDDLELSFSLGDDSISKTLNYTVDPSRYSGTYFGGAARIRNEFTVDFDTLSIFTEGVDSAPRAPHSLSAVPGNSSVTLNWEENPEPDLATYSIYRSTDSGVYDTALATDLPAANFVDNNALNGTTYFYVVTALDTAGNESAPSAEVMATPNTVLNVQVAATDSSTARSNNAIQDASEVVSAKRNDWTGSNARIAYLRFPLESDNQLGGINATAIDAASLQIYVTQNQASDTLWLYALKDSAQVSAGALSEKTWTGGSDGTETGGNNLQSSNRPDGELALPNANTTALLGSLTFAAGTDTGLKLISISDLAAFRDLIANDTNGEITLLIRGTMDSDVNNIASVFNSSGYQAPTLLATGEAEDPVPEAPTGLRATGANASIQLEWEDSEEIDLDYYRVYRTTNSGEYTDAHIMDLVNPAYTDAVVDVGNRYYYVVTAVDFGSNESPPSNEVSAITDDGDGIDDAWEVNNFGNADGDGEGDADADGIADFFEYVFASNPMDNTSRGSFFKAMNDGNSPSFSWGVEASFVLGTDYFIEVSTDMQDWDVLPNDHYLLNQNSIDNMINFELQITHSYPDVFFLRLERPAP